MKMYCSVNKTDATSCVFLNDATDAGLNVVTIHVYYIVSLFICTWAMAHSVLKINQNKFIFCLNI